MAESKACENRAFELGKVVGLQFHLESSMVGIDRLILNCNDELNEGTYVQRPKELLSHLDRFAEIRSLMYIFLDRMKQVLGAES